MKYSELIRKLEQDGWYLHRTNKHRIYRHPTKGQLTVPFHSKEIPKGMEQRLLKDAGLK
ncbi:type II toxin-antitoxin system HicA family toxin [Draconibacterium sp.]|uniref:type II toxin-antitoxin system HicA family toxin n=1 Tax=Draconibacterium sp. TaxID=1965318 RepID=UPI0035687444